MVIKELWVSGIYPRHGLAKPSLPGTGLYLLHYVAIIWWVQSYQVELKPPYFGAPVTLPVPPLAFSLF